MSLTKRAKAKVNEGVMSCLALWCAGASTQPYSALGEEGFWCCNSDKLWIVDIVFDPGSFVIEWQTWYMWHVACLTTQVDIFMALITNWFNGITLDYPLTHTHYPHTSHTTLTPHTPPSHLTHHPHTSHRGTDCEERKRPVVIHRAILGSVERMMAILTESFGGKWWVGYLNTYCV